MENATKQDAVSKSELIEGLGVKYTMTDNEKIIKWLGWRRVKGFRHVWGLPSGKRQGLTPDFVAIDADAITLLPVLVAKGFVGCLGYGKNGYDFAILGEKWGHNIVQQPTIATAISAAVLKLIADST